LFNNKPDNEADFCESYKSQILNNNSNETESSFNTILKTLIIILLLAIIVGLSIYGYNYLMNKPVAKLENSMPPSSIQISDDELKVTLEEPEESLEVVKTVTKPVEKEIIKKEVVETVEKETLKEPKIENIPVSPQTNESKIDQIANALKLSIAADEEKKSDTTNEKINKETSDSIESEITEEKNLEVPLTSSPEAKYLEDLAKLSKEIDKEMH